MSEAFAAQMKFRGVDGGPAFPTKFDGTGMKLRDYIAVHVAAGMLANPETAHEITRLWKKGGDAQKDLASTCYGFADAMIAARGESTP